MRNKKIQAVLALAFAMVLLPLAAVGCSNDAQTVADGMADRAPTPVPVAGPVPTDTPAPVPEDPPTPVPTVTAIRCLPPPPAADRATPVPTDAPPPTPKPTPTDPFENNPFSAAAALSEFFPWFHEPPDDVHASVVQPLAEVWLKDAELGRELARAPCSRERHRCQGVSFHLCLSNLFDLDPALARRMLAYSMEERVGIATSIPSPFWGA